MKNSGLVHKFLLTLLYCCIAFVSHATVKEWTGNINDSWNEDLNWTPTGVPGVLDSVEMFYGDFIVIPSGYTANIKRLRVLGELTIIGNLNIDGGMMDVAGDLTNYGVITVNNSPEDGLYTHSQTAAAISLENHGEIYITNASTYGFEVNHNSTLKNYGQVYIDGTGGIGFYIGTNANKINNYDLIQIENYISNGLHVLDSLENTGELLIDESGSSGLHLDDAEAYILNNTCGIIKVLNEINILLGSVENEGLFRQRFIHDNTIDGTFFNLGCLEDRENNFASGDINNQGIWIKNLTSEIEEGDSINNVFVYGYSVVPDIDVIGIYTDIDLLSSAGTYNQTTNKWVPNANAVGDSVFYAEIVVDNISCPYVVKFRTAAPVETVNYWTAVSGDFTDPSNWSQGIVPGLNDQTRIYNPNAFVFIRDQEVIQLNNVKNWGTLQIDPGGILQLKNNPENTYSLTCNNCDLKNYGTVTIAGADFGINIDKGYYYNAGITNVNNSSLGIYLSNVDPSDSSDELYNSTTGIIQGNNSILFAGGDLPVVNFGKIIGTNTNQLSPIIGSEHIINWDSIYLESSNSLKAIDCNTITNNNASSIIIKSFEEGVDVNILSNYGSITISECETGLTTRQTSINYASGIIDIHDCTEGLFIRDDFTNKPDAEIELHQLDIGINVYNSIAYTGYLFNKGNITIDSTTTAGIYAEGIFENQDSSNLIINHSVVDAINIYSGVFRNQYGSNLTIKNTGRHGIYCFSGSFENKKDGTFSIDSTASDGLFLTAISSFYNNGDGFFNSEISGYSIHSDNTCFITNDYNSGHLRLYRPFQIEGNVSNNGIWSQLSEAAPVIYPTFTNTGIVYDPNDLIESPFFTQTGAYINFIDGEYSVDDTIFQPIDLNFQNVMDYTFSANWYTDDNLSTIGANYMQNDNELVILPAAEGVSTFYFKSQNSIYNSIDTFSIELSNPISNSCGINTWTGGTGLWSSANNWSQNRVPTDCDSVVVSNETDSILVDGSDIYLIKSLSNIGSVLITENAELKVDNSEDIGVNNFGHIQIEGILRIVNAPQVGYSGKISSSLVNNGQLIVNNSGDYGIRINNGELTNSNLGSLLVQNSGISNIHLLNNGNLLQLGYLLSK